MPHTMIFLVTAATAFVLPARRLASVHPRQVLRPRTTQLRAAASKSEDRD